MVMALYGYGPIWLWPYMVMALYGYGAIQLWPYRGIHRVVAYIVMAHIVMAHYSHGPV